MNEVDGFSLGEMQSTLWIVTRLLCDESLSAEERIRLAVASIEAGLCRDVASILGDRPVRRGVELRTGMDWGMAANTVSS